MSYYPHPQPVRLRANVAASVLAGLLAVLTAGLLVWFAVANMQEHDYPAPWPSVVRINVIGGFGAAGVLAFAAMFTFAHSGGCVDAGRDQPVLRDPDHHHAAAA